jgi:hypothetical protein
MRRHNKIQLRLVNKEATIDKPELFRRNNDGPTLEAIKFPTLPRRGHPIRQSQRLIHIKNPRTKVTKERRLTDRVGNKRKVRFHNQLDRKSMGV